MLDKRRINILLFLIQCVLFERIYLCERTHCSANQVIVCSKNDICILFYLFIYLFIGIIPSSISGRCSRIFWKNLFLKWSYKITTVLLRILNQKPSFHRVFRFITFKNYQRISHQFSRVVQVNKSDDN